VGSIIYTDHLQYWIIITDNNILVSDSAADMVAKFTEMDKDGSGKLEVSEARQGLQEMRDATGRCLDEKEIDFFIRTTAGDDNVIDIGEFANLLFRLKVYKGKK